ncbi:hypothetical protein PMIN03_002196 [Paraphaeosphaeria minitans]
MVNKIQTVATNRPASRQTAMTTAVPSAYKPALTTNAPIRNPRLHPETGDLRQRSHSDHVTPSNKLLDARRFLLRYPIGCMPQYASLKPRQQAKLKGSIALLRRSTNRDYTLRSKHVQSYTYRRALMAPREAARVRKVRKVLGRYGPRITDEQFHEAVRKRRKRGTLIGESVDGEDEEDEEDGEYEEDEEDEAMEVDIGRECATDGVEETNWEKELRGEVLGEEFAAFWVTIGGVMGEDE